MLTAPQRPETATGLFVETLLGLALTEGLPVALWRLPGKRHPYLMLGNGPATHCPNPDLEELAPGFLAAPFLNHADTLYMAAGFCCQLQEREGKLLVDESNIFVVDGTGLQETAVKSGGGTAPTRLPWHPGRPFAGQTVARQHFCGSVAKAVAAIGQGRFQKTVLSRVGSVPLPTGFCPLETFRKMCAVYPAAFVSLVSLPGTGTWMGASPETLVSIDRQQVFRTVSLAGTQPAGRYASPAEASWRQKEIEEQALVSRYIINCFKKLRLREFEESGPRTVAAGSLLHLRTDFTADMKAVNFPQLGTAMLGLLHPTSAVCGMPKEPALAFIAAHEGYDRQLYSGYLGPVNTNGETHLYVNLRCMQLAGNNALVYAGAGITAESDPEQEWLETAAKMETMHRLLGRQH